MPLPGGLCTRVGVRNKAKCRYWSKPSVRSLLFIAGVRESGPCVSQAAEGPLTSTNHSAGRQAPDGYEQGVNEGCGDVVKQAAVSRSYQLACLVL